MNPVSRGQLVSGQSKSNSTTTDSASQRTIFAEPKFGQILKEIGLSREQHPTSRRLRNGCPSFPSTGPCNDHQPIDFVLNLFNAIYRYSRG